MTSADLLTSGRGWEQLVGRGMPPTPPVGRLRPGVDAATYAALAREGNEDPIPRALALSLRLPGAGRSATAELRQLRLLEVLSREIGLKAALFDPDRLVERLHLAQPVAELLTDAELRGLVGEMRRHFSLADDTHARDFAATLGFTTAAPERLQLLAELGFNQLTLKVGARDCLRRVAEQDPLSWLAQLLEAAVTLGYDRATVELEPAVWRCAGMLRPVLELAPSRLLLRHSLLRPGASRCDSPECQRRPSAVNPLQLVIAQLEAAGYRPLGNELFVLPGDPLLQALTERALHYDCHGYAAGGLRDHVGIGPGAVSRLGYSFTYNETRPQPYGRALLRDQLPTVRGVELDADARIRYDVYQQLICYACIGYAEIEQRHRISFANYFAAELLALEWLCEAGGLKLAPSRLELDGRARWLLPYVARVFTQPEPRPATSRPLWFSAGTPR